MSNDVLVQCDGVAGILSLNRPQALHALNLNMVHAMTEALLAWRDDPAIEVVMIDHAASPDGDPKLSRGFCAGGDISLLRNSALNDGGQSGRQFFYEEYQLNHLLFTYPKPIVAFMDGVTMGGGVGISQPARYRIATSNTRFAMPETGIGLFPDVGGGWYLSRLPGQIGKFLAVTGARIDGAECHALGLATHYLSSENLGDTKAALIAGRDDIHATLNAFAQEAPPARIVENRAFIDTLFADPSLEAILAALDADDSEWAAKESVTVRSKSPQSCKVALRQLEESAALADFADNMRMEYRLASRMLTYPDFVEGVRAVIVDKDNAPRWNPATPEAVDDALLDSIFAPLLPEQEWKPL